MMEVSRLSSRTELIWWKAASNVSWGVWLETAAEECSLLEPRAKKSAERIKSLQVKIVDSGGIFRQYTFPIRSKNIRAACHAFQQPGFF